MRFPLKKCLPTVAAICLLGLLSIGILKPLNNKEDSGTANNVTNSHLPRVVLDLDSESSASQEKQTEILAQNLAQLSLPVEIPPVKKENKNETHRKFLYLIQLIEHQILRILNFLFIYFLCIFSR